MTLLAFLVWLTGTMTEHEIRIPTDPQGKEFMGTPLADGRL